MILRRFMKHVTDQNWFAVGLDVIVVITGIFLGMQVSEWNEGRKERTEEEATLTRMHDELLTSLGVRKHNIDKRLQLFDALNSAIEAIFKETNRAALTSLECAAVYSSHNRSVAVATMPSLEALLTTGHISIIKNGELQAAMLEFSQRVNAMDRSNVVVGSKPLSTLYPYFFTILPSRNELNDLKANPTCDLDQMRQSIAFKAQFSINADIYDATIVSFLTPLISAAMRLHELLDHELGISHEGEG